MREIQAQQITDVVERLCIEDVYKRQVRTAASAAGYVRKASRFSF